MITLTDFVKICRLCLKNHEYDSVNLFSRQKSSYHANEPSELPVAEVIELFCNITVSKDDGLPQCICIDCWNIVSAMQNLQMVSLKSHQRLSEILNPPSSTTETNDLKHSEESLDIKIEFVDTQWNEESLDDDTKSIIPPKVKIEPSDEGSLESVTKPRTRRKVRTDESTNDTSEQKSYKPKKKLPCEICGKLVVSNFLEYHVNSHKGIRPFKCKADDCDKYFYSPDQAQQHYRKIHFDNITRPHKCDVCGAGFMQTTALATHRSYHFAPEIPCTICGQLYRNKKALKKHSLVHSGERNFSCSECDKSFQTRFTLKTHMRIHSNEKPYSCSQCSKAFAYKCLLKGHLEKHHRKESG